MNWLFLGFCCNLQNICLLKEELLETLFISFRMTYVKNKKVYMFPSYLLSLCSDWHIKLFLIGYKLINFLLLSTLAKICKTSRFSYLTIPPPILLRTNLISNLCVHIVFMFKHMHSLSSDIFVVVAAAVLSGGVGVAG